MAQCGLEDHMGGSNGCLWTGSLAAAVTQGLQSSFLCPFHMAKLGFSLGVLLFP
jgi:hypothetical protein